MDSLLKRDNWYINNKSTKAYEVFQRQRKKLLGNCFSFQLPSVSGNITIKSARASIL